VGGRRFGGVGPSPGLGTDRAVARAG
jgi:hypothetical protein